MVPRAPRVNEAPKGIKLQARVHIQQDEALPFCQLLVERKICTWTPDGEVLVVGGQKVLNGLFAVGQGTMIDEHTELQRTIMNLVPSIRFSNRLQVVRMT